MEDYVDQRLQRYDADVACMISANIRNKSAAWKLLFQKCTIDATSALELRIDAKLVELKQQQQQRCMGLHTNMK